jgi:hypothetical protein
VAHPFNIATDRMLRWKQRSARSWPRMLREFSMSAASAAAEVPQPIAPPVR